MSTKMKLKILVLSGNNQVREKYHIYVCMCVYTRIHIYTKVGKTKQHT